MSSSRILGLAAALATLAACGDGSVLSESAPSPPLPGRIQVSFRVDPRIARGVYQGDRWISPPYVRVGEGADVTVEARAYVLDAAGQPTAAAPAWRPSEPGMVAVTPAVGNEVNITVKRAGECRLQITGPGAAEELVIRASYPNGVIQVEIR